MNAKVLTENSGFLPTATYDDRYLNGVGGEVGHIPQSPRNIFTYNGMTFEYTGDGNINYIDIEYLTIDIVTEDLVFIMVGQGVFQVEASWGNMPLLEISSAGNLRGGESAISIQTQELAQRALPKIDEAILRKDQIRAHLGALQNRLENTVSNLQVQAENLQAAESRISDVDVALEMTEFVRAQILSQAAVAMLAQANSLPESIALRLIEGV
jgi:flagellin